MSTLIYDAADLPRLLTEGDRARRSGLHALWVWARAGARFVVEMEGKTFEHAPAPGPADALAWRRLGEVPLRKGRRFSLDIVVQRRYLHTDLDLIAGLALAPDAAFRPERVAAMTRVLAGEPGPVQDARLTSPRGTHTHFQFPEYASLRQWKARAKELRRRILVCAGLWPEPERRPLKARIFDRTEREDYTVEKVYFESYPGFFVTGNLYRPKGKPGPFPAVANPHGHWREGRLAHQENGSVPGRCINFARQGYVAFSYDMVGKVDSVQVPHDFRSDEAELWGVNLLGLQLWNSIRVVDFLQSLPDVDPRRIGCTGASGGGTQTFLLAAVDERVTAAAPVCMVSGLMQGGCLCENAPGLRVDTYNAEIAALIAPRPLLLVAATGDWTRRNPEEEYPAIRSVYKLFDAAERVQCVRFDAGHNYNKDSREAVYKWFARWLLGRRGGRGFKETPFAPEKERDLRVFACGQRPPGARDAAEVVESVKTLARSRLAVPRPGDADAFARFKADAAVGLRHALAARPPARAELTAEERGEYEGDGFRAQRFLLGRRSVGDAVPAVLFAPESGETELAVVAAHPDGKAAFVDAPAARPGPFLRAALERGLAVLTLDAFLTGEHHSVFARTEWDASEPHFWTFHRAPACERVQDLLTASAFLRSRRPGARVAFAGFGEAGLWALFAAALDPRAQAAAVDADRFDNTDDAQWKERFFAPPIRRVGDVAAAAALLAPARLLVHNAGDRFRAFAMQEAYAAADARRALTVAAGCWSDERLAEWLAS